MVHGGVGKYYRVDRWRLDGKRSPVAVAQLLVALEQAAVHEHALTVGLNQVAPAGHGARGTAELQGGAGRRCHGVGPVLEGEGVLLALRGPWRKVGRAAFSGRVCPYVLIAVVARELKKKKK